MRPRTKTTKTKSTSSGTRRSSYKTSSKSTSSGTRRSSYANMKGKGSSSPATKKSKTPNSNFGATGRKKGTSVRGNTPPTGSGSKSFTPSPTKKTVDKKTVAKKTVAKAKPRAKVKTISSSIKKTGVTNVSPKLNTLGKVKRVAKKSQPVSKAAKRITKTRAKGKAALASGNKAKALRMKKREVRQTKRATRKAKRNK